MNMMKSLVRVVLCTVISSLAFAHMSHAGCAGGVTGGGVGIQGAARAALPIERPKPNVSNDSMTSTARNMPAEIVDANTSAPAPKASMTAAPANREVKQEKKQEMKKQTKAAPAPAKAAEEKAATPAVKSPVMEEKAAAPVVEEKAPVAVTPAAEPTPAPVVSVSTPVMESTPAPEAPIESAPAPAAPIESAPAQPMAEIPAEPAAAAQ
jgi:hypothetical protein